MGREGAEFCGECRGPASHLTNYCGLRQLSGSVDLTATGRPCCEPGLKSPSNLRTRMISALSNLSLPRKTFGIAHFAECVNGKFGIPRASGLRTLRRVSQVLHNKPHPACLSTVFVLRHLLDRVVDVLRSRNNGPFRRCLPPLPRREPVAHHQHQRHSKPARPAREAGPQLPSPDAPAKPAARRGGVCPGHIGSHCPPEIVHQALAVAAAAGASSK